MKLRATAMVTMCALGSAWACGSASGTGLFDGADPSPTVCTESVACVGPGSCAGHRPCGANGALGDCACDAPSSGGASFGSGGSDTAGSGGAAGSGGDATGVGGFTSGGGSLSTGGAPEAGDATPEPSPAVCPVGSFSGKLTGTYTGSGGLSRADIGGSFTMAITADGSVTGSYTGPSSAKAMLVGSLDCATGALSVTIRDGTYQFGLAPVAFEGTLTGRYDGVQGRFVDGTWVMTEPANAQDGGSGTWTQGY